MVNETLIVAFGNTTTLPIQVVSQTNWSQYIISIIFGGIGILWLLSALFKVQIMTLLVRFHLWRLTRLTGRPSILIAHHDAGGFLSFSMITRADVLLLEKALVKAKGKDINLVIHSPGGDAFAGLLMSRMLKTYPGKVYGYVPQYAMSGGTLLALSTTKLHMNEYSCLGPIDPQVGGLFSSGPAAGWQEIVKKKGKKAEDKSYLFHRAGRQAETMIYDHMLLLLNNDKPMAKLFTDGRYHHGQPFTRAFLLQKGVAVATTTPPIDATLKKIVTIPMESTVVMNL
jgi:hypothetical protein